MTLAAVLLALAPAHAGDVEAAYPSGPPISIDDAETVEPEHAEINVTVGGVVGGGRWEAAAPLVDANLGLTGNIHVNAEMPLAIIGDAGGAAVGLGQAAVAVKVRVVHRDRVQIALHPAVDLPSIPGAGVDPTAGASLTVPVVLDLAVADTGAGVGLELAHTFTGTWSADGWQALAGFATPLAPGTVLMFDYAQEAGATGALGEGWFEAGLVYERLFGSDHLTMLTSLGCSTEARTAAMVGVQVGL